MPAKEGGDWGGVEMKAARAQFETIDEYIAAFPKDVQETLRILRRVIKESAPGAEEAIRYGIPTFRLNGNLVHFAAYKNHIGFYPTSSPLPVFKKELSPYKQGRGTIQFPIDKPIPFHIVKKIMKFRVRENSKKP
jgi:uncharacterized protein YdhG (YjbR/CyaY superfamily)